MFTLTLRVIAFALFCLTFDTVHAQANHHNQAHHQSAAKTWFDRSALMQFGVYYYPEQWPREQWQRDLANIKKLGFNFTHYAEFSWTYLEPEEGRFDFTWLDQAIALAEQQGLKVILCTPTPTPPAWMGEKYPEIYLVDEKGQRREHGNRANQSVSNQKYWEFVERIVTAMAQRYGHRASIMGWQVDNEPGATFDYSPSARQAFQQWLKSKYGTIEALNQAWLGSFWSTRYDRFEQILIPNTSIYVEDKLSPHAVLDFKRFTADAQADFLNRQAQILRQHIDPTQWITTNYTNVVENADPRRTTALDFASFTMYPVSGKNPLGGQSFRMGSALRIAEALDYYRPITGTTGVMELQPGQVNWAPVNPQLLPGTVHMWLMHHFGGGAMFACTYRYRHPLGSSEMYHDGIVGTDGVTLSQGGREFVQAMTEMRSLRELYAKRKMSNTRLPAELAARRTGFLWNHENLWDLETQKQTEAWNTWKHRNRYSAALKSFGAPVDFISEASDFSQYPFIVAPAYQLVDQQLLNRFEHYVKNGGHLILSARSASKDRNGHFFETPWADGLMRLVGAKLEFFDMLVPGVTGRVEANGKNYPWSSWADVLQVDSGTTVLARYNDQFYQGKAAASTRRLGLGSISYIGVESEDGSLEQQLLQTIYRSAKVSTLNLPKGVMIEWRDGFYVGVNYSNSPYRIPLNRKATVVVGKNPVAPAQSIIWHE